MDDVTSAVRALSDADDCAWLVGAFIRLVLSGALASKEVAVATADDGSAAEVLAAGGLLERRGDDFELSAELVIEADVDVAARYRAAVVPGVERDPFARERARRD